MENYEKLVKDSIDDARKSNGYTSFRKVHISKLLKRIYAKNPDFVKNLYLELFHSSEDEYGVVVNPEYRCALVRLCRRIEKSHNIRVWGHWGAFRGYVLDLVDIRNTTVVVLADEFLGL